MSLHKQKGRPKLNREKKDQGTEALQQKRRALFTEGALAEMPLTGSLLGLFYGLKVIPKSHYEAGRHFAKLAYQYEACLGYSFRARRSGLLLERGNPYEAVPEEKERKRIRAWRGIPEALLKKRGDLRQGLKCLKKYFKM